MEHCEEIHRIFRVVYVVSTDFSTTLDSICFFLNGTLMAKHSYTIWFVMSDTFTIHPWIAAEVYVIVPANTILFNLCSI